MGRLSRVGAVLSACALGATMLSIPSPAAAAGPVRLGSSPAVPKDWGLTKKSAPQENKAKTDCTLTDETGKTTLVASLLEARERPGIWYQVDAGDADPASFVYHLRLAAMEAGAGPGAARAADATDTANKAMIARIADRLRCPLIAANPENPVRMCRGACCSLGRQRP